MIKLLTITVLNLNINAVQTIDCCVYVVRGSGRFRISHDQFNDCCPIRDGLRTRT